MGEMIFDALGLLIGTNLIKETSDFMQTILTALNSFFTNGQIDLPYSILSGVAASLLILFFYMDMMDRASRDMFTFERLVTSFIKIIFAVVLLIYLKDIIITLFQMTKALYQFAVDKLTFADVTNPAITFFKGEGNKTPNAWPKDYSQVKDAFESDEAFGSGVTGVLSNIGKFIPIALVTFVCFLCKLASLFVAISNAISIIVRAIFAPIGVVQLFEDGQRSNGIQYLKKFVADALIFMVIIGILYASSQLTGNMLIDILGEKSAFKGAIKASNVKQLIDLKMNGILRLLLIQLGTAGAILGASKIAHDIVGVH